MKRFCTLLLVLVMMLSLFSCSSSIALEETKEKATAESSTKVEQATGDIVYPEGFSVGYARADITPTNELPIPIYDRDATGIHDPLYLTCTAICDGEGVAIMFGADLKSCAQSLWKQSAKIIEKKFGIPEDRVFINTTHTHNAHTYHPGRRSRKLRLRLI